MTVKTPQQSRLRRRRRRAREGQRHRAAPAHLRLPLQPRHLRAAVDDLGGRTLAAVAWTEDDLRSLGRMEQAKQAGQTLARRAKEQGVDSAVFDRGGYQYHGRVKAFAEGVREGGLTV
jgi:large subunit ribosomal protein L18